MMFVEMQSKFSAVLTAVCSNSAVLLGKFLFLLRDCRSAFAQKNVHLMNGIKSVVPLQCCHSSFCSADDVWFSFRFDLISETLLAQGEFKLEQRIHNTLNL